MTIVSIDAIKKRAQELADTGASLAESQPYPPDSEHAEVFAQAFNDARTEAA